MKLPSLLYFEEVILSPLLYLVFWVENNIWTFEKTPKCNKSWDANDFKYYFKIVSIGFIIHFHFLSDNWRSHISFSLYFISMNGNVFETQTGNLSKSEPNKFRSAPHHSPLYFIYFEEVILSSLMKILEWHKVSDLKYSQMEFKSFSNPFSFL